MCWAGDFLSKLCFMHHFIFWTLILSNRLCKGLKDSDLFHLAQSVEHWCNDQEVLGSIPTRINFWLKFFALSCVNLCWQCCQLCIILGKIQMYKTRKNLITVIISINCVQFQNAYQVYEESLPQLSEASLSQSNSGPC